MQDEKNTSANIGERINAFIQRNRKGIFTIGGILIALFVGLVVFLSLQDVFQKRAISEMEELNKRFEDLRLSIADEPYSSDIQALLADLNTFTEKRGFAGSGFAKSKALSIIAQIYSDRKEWSLAEEAWIKTSEAGNKTYLGPLSLFNAAAAAEEQGKYEQAIEYLEKCIAHPFEFPSAPRAQFSIGRLYEKMNNYPAAIEAYRMVIVNWQDIPVWQLLARSAIINIEVR